jgi:hypothetical protein
VPGICVSAIFFTALVLWAPRSSLFIQHSYSQTLYVLIYVDDIVITGSHAGAIRGLIASLATEFAIKDQGPLHYFLGV